MRLMRRRRRRRLMMMMMMMSHLIHCTVCAEPLCSSTSLCIYLIFTI
jgi:hypothetical protein